jgi:hypothetical protein
METAMGQKLKATWCKNNAHIPIKSETVGQHQLHYNSNTPETTALT